MREKKLAELASLLFETKQLIRDQLPAQRDPSAWLRLETLTFIALREDTTMRDIAGYLRIKPPSVTSLISALERAGLVKRGKHSKDRRSVHVSLTSRGEKALKAYRSSAARAIERVFSRLDRAEIDTLVAVLSRLHEPEDATAASS